MRLREFRRFDDIPDELRQGTVLNHHRGPANFLHVGDFIRLLEKHKHPRWLSIGVYSSLHHRALDEDAMDPAFSGPKFFVWAADAHKKTMDCCEPLNYPWIPYWSYDTTYDDSAQNFDYDKNRWKIGRAPKNGWRSEVSKLVRRGFLKPSEELSYLIGEDTFRLGRSFNL